MGKGSVIILLFIVLVQWVFGFFQVMKYDRFLQDLRRKYHGCKGYYLYAENIKKMTGLVSVVLVMDHESIIREAYLYSGVFALAEFKNIREIRGLSIFDEELCLKVSGYRKDVCVVMEKIRNREDSRKGGKIC